jgi:hypothetical protein
VSDAINPTERLGTPQGMIQFIKQRLEEIDYVYKRIPKTVLNKTTEMKYHDTRLRYEKINHDQEERIKRGETRSMDEKDPNELLEMLMKFW